MPQAAGLVAELEHRFGKDKVHCELIKGSGGVFDVVLNGEKIYSKHDMGRFPQYREVVKEIEHKIIRS